MSEDNKITEPSTNEAQNQDNQQPQFQIPTEAADFVGDGKKYNSVEDALKSVPHAQKHIQTLESELAAAREELAKRRTTEELLDEIKSGIQPQATPADAEPSVPVVSLVVPDPPLLELVSVDPEVVVLP